VNLNDFDSFENVPPDRVGWGVGGGGGLQQQFKLITIGKHSTLFFLLLPILLLGVGGGGAAHTSLAGHRLFFPSDTDLLLGLHELLLMSFPNKYAE
jgi:hypothetical protein